MVAGGMTTESKSNLLADFLASRAPAGSLSLVALDGYLTAVLVGPTMIPPSEWMPGIWGDGPTFDDEAEAQAVLGALMLRYNGIIKEIDKGPGLYRPYDWPADPDERASIEQAAEWSIGFWRGMRLRPYEWRPMIQDVKARILLAPILCFIETEDGRSVLQADPQDMDELMSDAVHYIPEVVPTIRDYWTSGAFKTRQPQAHKPGRNDPCPCGSGKKYKRCCGS